jgi:hypothetical protein
LLSGGSANLQLLSVESKLFVQDFEKVSLELRKLVTGLVDEDLGLRLLRVHLINVKVIQEFQMHLLPLNFKDFNLF